MNDSNQALVNHVRELVRSRKGDEARVVASALISEEQTRQIGYVCLGSLASLRGLQAFASEAFARAGSELSLEAALAEYLRASVSTGARSVSDWLASNVPDAAVELIQLSIGLESRDQVDHAIQSVLSSGHVRSERLKRIITKWRAAADQSIPAGRNSLAILGFDSPDEVHASRSLGDYMQGVGVLTLLAHFDGLEIHCEPGLRDLLSALQLRLAPGTLLQPPKPAKSVQLVDVERDLAGLATAAKWIILFGRSPNRLFDGGFSFPPPHGVSPVFVGYHIADPQVLTDDVIAYLRAHGPIGCRNWNSTALLLSLGVDAFMSGSVSSLLSCLQFDPPGPASTAYVEVEPAGNATGQVRRWSQTHEELLDLTLSQRLKAAFNRLERLASFERVVTSHIECAIACSAIRRETVFTPKAASDRRYDGLEPPSPRLRQNLLSLLGLILEDRGPEEVYRTWKTLWQEEVQQAKSRFGTPPARFAVPFSIQAAKAGIEVTALQSHQGNNSNRRNNPVDLALAADALYKKFLPTVLESVTRNTRVPLRVWLLCRGVSDSDRKELAELFPTTDFRFLSCDRVDYGPVIGMLPHLSISTMDRLMLPELLAELDKVVYLDLDIIVQADIAELFATDVSREPLAGRLTMLDEWLGFNLIHKATGRLPRDRAAELRHRMLQRSDLRFRSFNAGVLVMNLKRMRADRFCEEFIPFAERYGMYDQEILNAYAGSNRVELNPTWNGLPAQEFVESSNIIHWAGKLKPWNVLHAQGRSIWLDYHQRVQNRLSPGSVYAMTGVLK